MFSIREGGEVVACSSSGEGGEVVVFSIRGEGGEVVVFSISDVLFEGSRRELAWIVLEPFLVRTRPRRPFSDDEPRT